MEAVEARLGRLLKPAANRKQQQQPEQLLLNDLSLEPTTISSAASGDDHNLDDFEMIAMTAEETKNLPTALDSSFRWDTAGLWIQICFPWIRIKNFWPSLDPYPGLPVCC